MAAKQAKSDFAAEQRQFNEAIRSGDLKSVYLLCGEQAYLRLQNRDKLVKALIGDGDAMNLSRYTGSGCYCKRTDRDGADTSFLCGQESDRS